ncbi:hypothetical protein K438DRAFT_1803978 [Mycena galopus ATCC 62051]|nr:hypothetical protein K438DRAFT_1803978 [Mycena galopus ATCC 62051]
MAPSIQKFEDADFLVRSLLDGSSFAVNRAKLERGSRVFRDMFLCCDAGAGDENQQYLRETDAEKFQTQLPVRYDSSTAIPLPYALSDLLILESLRAHLLAHAPTDGLTPIHPPVAWYTPEEAKIVPTVVAYQDVLRLQAFRVKALQDILLRKSCYGMCPTHKTSALAVWDRTRLILARKIETNTDVAGEMESLVYIFQSCATCCKAFKAAVDMLAYKCRRVPRRLDQLPDDGCPGFDD